MTAEEMTSMAVMQRTMDRLTDNLEKMAEKLDGQIAATATGFESVRIDLASVKARFIGGWFVVCALGAIGVVLISLMTQFHVHFQF